MWGAPRANAVKPSDPPPVIGRAAMGRAAVAAAGIGDLLRGTVDLQGEGSAGQQMAQQRGTLQTKAKEYRESANRSLENIRASCDSAGDWLKSEIAEAERTASDGLQQAIDGARQLFEDLENEIGGELKDHREQVLLRWRIEQRRLLGEVGGFRGKMQTDVSDAFDLVTTPLEAAEKNLEELNEALDLTLRTAEIDLDVVKGKLRGIGDRAVAAADTAINSLEGLPPTLNERGKELAKGVRTFKKKTLAGLKVLDAWLEELNNELLRSEARRAAGEFLERVSQFRRLIEGVENEIIANIEHFGDVELSAATTAIDGKLQEIAGYIGTTENEWAELHQEVQGWTDQLSHGAEAVVKQHLEDLQKGATALGGLCELLNPKLPTVFDPNNNKNVCELAKQGAKRQLKAASKLIEQTAAAAAGDLSRALIEPLRAVDLKNLDLDGLKTQALDAVAKASGEIGKTLDLTGSQLTALLATGRERVDIAFGDVEQQLKDLAGAVDDWDGLNAPTPEQAREQVLAAFSKARKALAEAEPAATAATRKLAAGNLDRVQAGFRRVGVQLETWQARCLETVDAYSLDKAKELVLGEIMKAREGAKRAKGIVEGQLSELESRLNVDKTRLEGGIDERIAELEGRIMALPDAAGWEGLVDNFEKELKDGTGSLAGLLVDHVSNLEQTIDKWGEVCNGALATIGDLATLARSVFGGEALRGLERRLGDSLAGAAREIEETVRRWADDAAAAFQRLEFDLPIEAPDIDLSRLQAEGLRLIRMFGDVPKVPQLDFNVDLMAFHFVGWDVDKDWLPSVDLPKVDLSRIAAMVNKSLTLPSMDITLPSINLGEVFGTPGELSGFDFTALFPKIAGIDAKDLFKGLKLRLSEKDVKITHGEDLASRSAWVRADVNFEFGKPATIFNFGGISMVLRGARVEGWIKAEGGLDRETTHTEFGRLKGDWEIRAGGMPVVILRQASLTKEVSGRIQFDVTPEKIELQQSFQFLNDLMAPFQEPGDGLTFDFDARGATVRLDLPMPDIQAGTFRHREPFIGLLLRRAV